MDLSCRLELSGMSRTLFGSACRRIINTNVEGRSSISAILGIKPLLHRGTCASPLSRGSWRGRHAAVPTTEAPPALDQASPDGTFKSTAYPFTEIEGKWQAFWEEHQTFRTPEFKDLDTSKPKFYALDMFPYPR